MKAGDGLSPIFIMIHSHVLCHRYFVIKVCFKKEQRKLSWTNHQQLDQKQFKPRPLLFRPPGDFWVIFFDPRNQTAVHLIVVGS